MIRLNSKVLVVVYIPTKSGQSRGSLVQPDARLSPLIYAACRRFTDILNSGVGIHTMYDYKKYLNCSYHLKADYFQGIYKYVSLKNNASAYITLNFSIIFKN